ncbi:RCC1-like domain-containing protein, partial [Nocardioides sp. NPDC057764]
GRASAVGGNDAGQCDVVDWREIVAVAAGSRHTLGLRADGSVVATGSDEHGQCDVTGWPPLRR